MRRATLGMAVFLCFVATVVIAGPVQLEPTFEAEASATWGVQLDEMTTGFANSATSTIMFTFIEEQTAEYGEGTTYGYIEVEDFEVEFEAEAEDGTVGANDAFDISVGSITGKVFFGRAYLVVYSGADDAVDELNDPVAIGGAIMRLRDSSVLGFDPNVLAEPTTEYGGVALGFDLADVMTVELGVASRYEWDNPLQQTNSARNAYVWSFNADITPIEGLSVAVVSNMWHGIGGAEEKDGERITPYPGTPGNPASVGVSAGYDLALWPDMILRPVLGFDLATEQDAEEDQEFRWEVGTGINLLWPALGVDEEEEEFLNGEYEVTSGVGIGAVLGSLPTDNQAPGVAPSGDQAPVLAGITEDKDLALRTLAFKLGLYEDSGDEGLLPVVGAAVLMNYNMVLGDGDIADAGFGGPVFAPAYEDGWADFGIGVELNADLGIVSPYAGFISEMFNVTGNDELFEGETLTAAFMNAGTDIHVIPNTTFTLDYSSGDLLYDAVDQKGQGDDATWGYYYGTTTDGGTFSDSRAGRFTIQTMIEF